jgi:AraC family transcriptional regulator
VAGIAGVGMFVSWSGGAMLIGRQINVIIPIHAHYAIQVSFGKEYGVGFRGSDDEPWRQYRGAIIPSRQPHSMDATKMSANAVMFVEPETREGRVLEERFLKGGIAEMPEEAMASTTAVFAAFEKGDEAAMVAACKNVIRALTGDVGPLEPSDERILRAIDHINSHLDGKLTLPEVAGAAFLSPSRFRHLFVEESGLQLRP